MLNSTTTTTTKATAVTPSRHYYHRRGFYRYPSLLLTLLITAFAGITTNFLCRLQQLHGAAAFIFAQGQNLPPPPPAFVAMPPSPATSILLGRRFASRSGNHHQQRALVDKLRREGVINHDEVAKVMQQVDRANYASASAGGAAFPYDDSPQGIACGQTISAPHMHGYALEYMLSVLEKKTSTQEEGAGGAAVASTSSNTDEQHQQQEENEATTKVLDVGCGSGYLTAALGRWVHPHDGTNEPRILSNPGKVYGMDIHPQLVDMTRQNIQKEDGDLLESETVTLKVGNGWDGWPEAAPFDAIHVGAAAEDFPAKLANQLRVGGIMIVPIGPTYGMQYLYKVERIADTGNIDTDFLTYRLLGVRYVPLIRG